ncbi:MAG: [protein-PII] uridylyltransferase, partial [Succinivibrio sp.]
MFEAIVLPRKVIETKVEEAFPYQSDITNIFDPKLGREDIKRYKEYRRECFIRGFKVSDLLETETQGLDRFLGTIFARYTGQYDFLTLVAVGGYGRREQFVESDIDLLIVSGLDPIPEDARAAIESFVSFLWDLKLDLGTSVRTIRDTIIASREDLTIISNLIENHYIAGNEDVFHALNEAIFHDDFWDDEKFFDAKVKEQEERYHKFHDTIYSLEPDVKDSPGGLRDLHVMQWIALKLFHLTKYDNLCTIGLLTSSEYDEYLACREFLWGVRYAIHCNSTSNILRLDFQKAVASMLGYGDEGNGPVESMMRDLFRTFHRVMELNHILLQKVSLTIKGYVGDEFCEPVFITNEFVQRGNYIDVVDHELFKNDPVKILDLFLAIGYHPEINSIHVNCLRALREGRRELKDYLITVPECRKKFKEILHHSETAHHVLNLMHETRVLTSYMPQWSKIEGLAQFDRFHLFSVDEHTIRVIKNIHELSHSKDPIHQLFKHVSRKIADHEILLTAALLHDIAKGRGGNHALKGAKEAESFCRLHEFNEFQTAMVSWLIESHLMFNTTASRRDITDLEVINNFADFVKDEDHLNKLYCLTVADIAATNDNGWTSWKDNIFRQLYQATKFAIRNGETDLVKSMMEQAQERQKRVIDLTLDCKKADL